MTDMGSCVDVEDGSCDIVWLRPLGIRPSEEASWSNAMPSVINMPPFHNPSTHSLYAIRLCYELTPLLLRSCLARRAKVSSAPSSHVVDIGF